MLPMFVSFAFAEAPLVPDIVVCFYMVLIGLAMISQIPTWSFKTTRISRGNVRFFLVGFAIIGAAALTFTWVTLAALCVAYIAMVIVCPFIRSPEKNDGDD